MEKIIEDIYKVIGNLTLYSLTDLEGEISHETSKFIKAEADELYRIINELETNLKHKKFNETEL